MTEKAQLTHGSLFAGIGGFDLGFERAGIKTVWQVEIDPFCRKVLERHWPQVPRFADIREYGQRFILERPDVVTGGFPCQDLSKAGRRAGIDGARSGLWKEMRRVVCSLRPNFVLVENVPGLLESGLGRVLGDLAACGFDAEWECLPASAFGAPHLRDRTFVVAYPNGKRCVHGQIEGFPATTRLQTQRDTATSGKHREIRRPAGILADVADANSAGLADIQGSATFAKRSGNGTAGNCRWWDAEPAVGRVVDGIRDRLDIPRLKGLGNAVVPQIAEWIGRRIIESGAK